MNVQRKISVAAEKKVRSGNIVSGGRLQIPAEFRREMGLTDGDSVRMWVEGGELRVKSLKAVVKDIQDLLRPYKREGVSIVDEFIAERRAEAEKE